MNDKPKKIAFAKVSSPDKDMVPVTNSGKFSRIVRARAGGEMCSLGASLGAISIVETLVEAGPLEPIRSFFSKRVVEPNLDLFDRVGKNLPSIVTEDDHKRLEKLDKRHQSYYYTDLMTDYTVGFVSGYLGQEAGQPFFNKVNMVPDIGKKFRHSLNVDYGVQLGTMILLNTALPKTSMKMQEGLASILHKQVGMDEDTARARANFLVNIQLANLVGAVAGVAMHHNLTKNLDWKPSAIK